MSPGQFDLASITMHRLQLHVTNNLCCEESHTLPLQDRTIGHQVITLAGAVPAANYLQLPKDKMDSLALTGRFLYLQVLCSSGLC